MKCKLNARAVISFILFFLIGIAVLITLGHNPVDIFAAIAFWAVFFLVIYWMDKAGLGKYFGGKT